MELAIDYGARALEVRIADDGIGIDPVSLREGGPYGHYGLVGMTERARGLKGSLTISSPTSGGTVILLRVPAAIAYGKLAGSLLSRWRHSRRRDD